ncbi:MAG: dTMP kinase, partial [Candidatus Korarchaeota archaeon]|nr:dTMP kinase [Candidatus Korarchaeota archaeon]
MGKKGFFVCIEGLDGCGKTTQTRLLVEQLGHKGYDAIYTTEPTQGEIGEFIRKYCLHGRERISSVVEALLFAADRFEHVEKTVAPAIGKERFVVS